MAESYVRPGNQERGWNDPPQLSYGLQVRAGGARRSPLTRRTLPPPAGTPPAPGRSPGPTTAPGPPPRASGPPPPGPLRPRPSAAAPPEEEQEEAEADPAAVLAPLRAALLRCRPALQAQLCDDIGRRLALLEDAWAQGKLSAPVRKRMGLLVRELQQQHWDAADEIHRSLMVDHVHEVSQWLVGVKRLIAEARSLQPTQLPTAATDLGLEQP